MSKKIVVVALNGAQVESYPIIFDCVNRCAGDRAGLYWLGQGQHERRQLHASDIAKATFTVRDP